MEAFMEQKEKNETKRPEQEKEKNELQEMKDNQIKETGQLVLEENEKGIYFLKSPDKSL